MYLIVIDKETKFRKLKECSYCKFLVMDAIF